MPTLCGMFTVQRQELRQQQEHRGHHTLGGFIKIFILAAALLVFRRDDAVCQNVDQILRLAIRLNAVLTERFVHIAVDKRHEIVAIRACRVSQVYHRDAIAFARLSPDGSICGVTAYADTEYKITELGITRTLALKRNQVILDESFILSGNVQRLCAKRRFTLAHECAHQILFQLESEEVKASCEMRYSARTAYTPRELKTREDWNEWQANVLGAAILLPQKEVDLAMRRFAETPLINYEGRYSYGDHLTLRLFCRLFGVSKTTASIRLRQLGYMVDRPFSEYVDPLEVW